MVDRVQFDVNSSNSLCVGTGLIALDVLINGKNEGTLRLWAGGSCGNVLTILAYMGWLSYPIANLGEDRASDIILSDIRRWGVKTDFIYRSQKTITPIIIEKLNNNGRTATHEFKFKCPICGSPLPRNKPVPSRLLQEIIEKIPVARVYYFDRISRAAIKLAKEQRLRGALIVFEPCKFSREKLFKECLKISHIVKYSREQIDIHALESNIPLEIQTLGSEGLRYRFRKSEEACQEWKKMQAFHVSDLIDSAGAGDWCTAGIIHLLGQKGAESFFERSEEEVEEALKFGQVLAALKCSYEGARGLMHSLSRNELESLACKVIEGKSVDLHVSTVIQESERRPLQYICPSCGSKERNG